MAESDTAAPILAVSGLNVRYGGIIALREVDLTVAHGETVVVLGLNGAGKSSLLNTIAGVVRRASGSVLYEGREISGTPTHTLVRRGLSQVPEGRRILGPLTVEENLTLGGFTQHDRKRRAELLDVVHTLFPVLHERRRQLGGLLSGGEQQMLAFGRALMGDPQMLLLDEPSMGLAPIMVDRIFECVAQISKRGISILMVEQNASALELCDRAYVLEQGRIVMEGTGEDMRDDERVRVAAMGL